MRKLVSLSLLASSFIMFSTTPFAGNVEECEFLKDGDYTKGLYGLCIAYYNAGNDNANEFQVDINELYCPAESILRLHHVRQLTVQPPKSIYSRTESLSSFIDFMGSKAGNWRPPSSDPDTHMPVILVPSPGT